MLFGKDEQEAKDLALDLIASLQGSLLLAASFRSPELLEQRLQRLHPQRQLRRWVGVIMSIMMMRARAHGNVTQGYPAP